MFASVINFIQQISLVFLISANNAIVDTFNGLIDDIQAMLGVSRNAVLIILGVFVLIVFITIIMLIRMMLTSKMLKQQKKNQKLAGRASIENVRATTASAKPMTREARSMRTADSIPEMDMEIPVGSPTPAPAPAPAMQTYSAPEPILMQEQAPQPQPLFASQPQFYQEPITIPPTFAPTADQGGNELFIESVVDTMEVVPEQYQKDFSESEFVLAQQAQRPVVQPVAPALSEEEQLQRDIEEAKRLKEQRLQEYYARQAEEAPVMPAVPEEDLIDFGVIDDYDAGMPDSVLANQFDFSNLAEDVEPVEEPIAPEEEEAEEAHAPVSLGATKIEAVEQQQKVRDRLTSEDIYKKIFEGHKTKVPKGAIILPKCLDSYLRQASNETKTIYTRIKNELLSYRGVHCRMLTNVEVFRKSGLQAKLTIKGKTLYLYLAIDPSSIDPSWINCKVKDMSNKKAFVETPSEIRISGKKKVNSAVKLIAAMFEAQGIEEDDDYEEQDYAEQFPYVHNGIVFSRNLDLSGI